MTKIRATIFETLPRTWKHPPKSIVVTSVPNRRLNPLVVSHFATSRRIMASSTIDEKLADFGIENKDIQTAPGVSLSDSQRLITGSVLDLFAGRPSIKKLSLWTDGAKFEDPLTIAEGRKQYSAQWYGLVAAFSRMERLSHQVTSSGNPITMDLKTRYVVKGIGKEQTISSVIKIYTEDDKITRLEDRWNDQLPEGAIKTALRQLNSVVVPAFVSVPKSDD